MKLLLSIHFSTTVPEYFVLSFPNLELYLVIVEFHDTIMLQAEMEFAIFVTKGII